MTDIADMAEEPADRQEYTAEQIEEEEHWGPVRSSVHS